MHTELVTDYAGNSTKEFNVAVVFTISPNWHIYWKNSGTTGIPTTIKWTLPAGLSMEKTFYPAPKRYDNDGLVDYIHEDTVAFVGKVIVEDATVLKSESLQIIADIDWLECDNICVPGSSRLGLMINPSSPISLESKIQTKINETLDLSKEVIHGRISNSNGQINIYIPIEQKQLSTIEGAYFFSNNPINDAAADQILTIKEDGILITTLASTYGEPILEQNQGLLRLNLTNNQSEWLNLNLSQVERIETTSPPLSTEKQPNLLVLIALAYLGGLILNLMPCVFPIIGLKIMGFVEQAGQDSKKIMTHGLVFAAGVIVSFWILSGLLLILRAGGEQLGWGFQLQEPWFNYALILLLFTFALSLNGVFEFGMSAIGIGNKLTHKSGMSGSFFSGVLATVVATPCSAPFLAPALGAALALNPFQSLLVFTVIAIGLSTPYLILSLFPSVLNKLPRPGAWMETFKQFMAFPLYGTVAYLVWAIFGQINESNQFNLLLSLVGVGMGLWIFGRWAIPSKSKKTRFIAIAVTASVLIASVILGHPKEKKEFWEAWSPELVEKYRDEGKTVYVDFTARWCATCQLNKRIVFSSSEVLNVFKSQDVVALKADWTNRDERITLRLRELGKAAVPVTLIYKKGKNEPVILPEVLTPNMILKALEPSI